jgi:hypothetical protein
MHGFEAGFTKYSHFNKNHSLLVGLFFGAFGRNFNYSIPGTEFNPPIAGDLTSNTAVSREFNFTGSVPILFEKRWAGNNNGFWDLDIGVTVRYTPYLVETEDHIWTDSNGHHPYFHLQLTINDRKAPWLNYNVGGGYSWILKNNNLFKTTLITSLCFASYVSGPYQFTVPNQPIVEGTYDFKGSYIGLSLSYVLTRSKR